MKNGGCFTYNWIILNNIYVCNNFQKIKIYNAGEHRNNEEKRLKIPYNAINVF